MSDYSDRLDRIREGRDKTYAGLKSDTQGRPDIPATCLPQMHKDLYWLLEIVTMYDDEVQSEISIQEMVSEAKMMGIMGG